MIPVFKPSYDEEELIAIKDCLETGWVGLGPKTKEFEDKFSEYIGVKHSVGLNSCTAALHLAMLVMDIEGGEVITSPMTFISTNHAILYNGAIPVFVDIEADTLNIDVNKIEEKISDRTKAIIVVHFGGHPCDMEPVLNLARRRGIAVIEDAAHGSGSEYKGKKVGSLGDIACFSFHAVKNLAVGEGGMITVNDDQIDDRLRKLRWLGINKSTWARSEKENKYSWQYDIDEIGFKCHMNDIPAAIGLIQLKKLDKLNARRREIVNFYNEGFKDLEWIERPVEKDYAKSSLHNYIIKVEGRDNLAKHLMQNGIATSVHYYPNHLYSIYSKYYTKLEVAENIWEKILTLPLYPDMPDQDVEKIIEEIRNFKK